MKLKLVGHKIKSSGKPAYRGNDKKSKFLLVLLGTGILTFGLAVLLYAFQNKIPRFNLDSSDIVMPVNPGKQQIDFSGILQKNGIVFDSITYASESPTLIVKLSDGTYVYFNSTENPTPAIKVLKNILSRLSIADKNKKVKYIDLRLQQAVVKF